MVCVRVLYLEKYAGLCPAYFSLLKSLDFNKEYMSSLKMIWMRSKHAGVFLSVLIWMF